MPGPPTTPIRDRPDRHNGGLSQTDRALVSPTMNLLLRLFAVGSLLTASLCSAADGGEILLTDDMRRALRKPPRVKERAPMELKGKAQPVPVYSVVR